MDSKTRTFVKTFSYRTVVAVSLFLTALAMNYSAGFGLKFFILSFTVGFISFLIHERIWNLFDWGRHQLSDSRIRSLAKTVTWRIWAFIVLFVLGLILGLNSSEALEWTIVTNILFVVVHYIHERLWNLVSWGKQLNSKENLA
jgi:uncharacterized membrane protein